LEKDSSCEWDENPDKSATKLSWQVINEVIELVAASASRTTTVVDYSILVGLLPSLRIGLLGAESASGVDLVLLRCLADSVLTEIRLPWNPKARYTE
jgi:hypothetical protein